MGGRGKELFNRDEAFIAIKDSSFQNIIYVLSPEGCPPACPPNSLLL